MDELHHECGIAAVYQLDHLDHTQSGKTAASARLIPRMLRDIQNRGQLAAGFTAYDPTRRKLLNTFKDLGTVAEVFRLNHPAKFENIMINYPGYAGIGHVRYATCGQVDLAYAQPFECPHGRKWKWFTFCFNGQL